MKYLLVAIALLGLYVSNPNIQEFSFFVREKVSDQMKLDDDLANVMAAELLSAAVIEATYRNDYLLASKFTVDTSGLRLFAPDLPVKIEVLGVAGQFIPLNDFN